MQSSMSAMNNTDRTRSKKKKKKKLQNPTHNNDSSSSSNSNIRNWKSQSQQQIYSKRLVRALRQVTIGGGGSVVRAAADRALAATASGSTRWSRAILTARRARRRKISSAARICHAPPQSKHRRPRVSVLRLRAKNLAAVQRKARVLGRLVPGCRKESLPVILEEAEDYIPALQMQIRAMTNLLNSLASSPSSSS